ncbi:DUF4279 domain-containing protein [Adhaeribacter swui]|uniref:DUF4279 domain-containing protein n=1 Tax=Adhaeribacter swui TaxID=2086471 RepID=A0A7G7GAN3_9BACT|nr:DUF4279 domain-containing protein [Adhaeribacter swui]QNF34217.1 DUF4279 domain-containing protein [Adhaeribacter swui]
MSEEEIIFLVTEELQNPILGVTQQYLEIHKPVTIDDRLKIDKVNTNSEAGTAIVYIPVVGACFHFAVYVDLKEKAVTGVGTESYNRVYFRVTSDLFTLDELKAFTTLSPTYGWSKGDLSKTGNQPYNFSSIEFMPNPEPDEFENKLSKLLDFLEQDTDGVRQLVAEAHGGITVVMDFHNGNGMLGGMYIDSLSIQRMGKLNLFIDFDLYASGNSFKE